MFRHEDVKRVLSDHDAFSSRRGSSADPLSTSLISTDPPRHRQLRSLVTTAFTPRAIANLSPRIDAIANELIACLPEPGQALDIVELLTTPLPVIVIAELLGIPAEDRERFKLWSDAVIAGSRQAESGEAMTYSDAQREMVAYFADTIRARSAHPKDDLISALTQAKVDGESLSQMDILGFCILLLVAGNETTTNLLSNSLFTLHERPALWQTLAQDPAKIPDFIEEVLRHRSPVQHMYRRSTKQVTLSGVTIPAESHFVAWIGSANRDEAMYADPDEFVIDRRDRHLAFGHGIHFCLGAPLARLEAKQALEALVKRYQGVVIPNPDACEMVPTSLVYGFAKLPAQFLDAEP